MQSVHREVSAFYFSLFPVFPFSDILKFFVNENGTDRIDVIYIYIYCICIQKNK